MLQHGEVYINPLTDFGFKRIFGTKMNKDLLISFLNALFNGEKVIEDIQYVTPDERRDYEVSSSAYRDIKNGYDSARETGYNKGMAEGMEKGLAQGMEKGLEQGKAQGLAEGLAEGAKRQAMNIARNLKQSGMPSDQIVQLTGLSEAEINKL